MTQLAGALSAFCLRRHCSVNEPLDQFRVAQGRLSRYQVVSSACERQELRVILGQPNRLCLIVKAMTCRVSRLRVLGEASLSRACAFPIRHLFAECCADTDK